MKRPASIVRHVIRLRGPWRFEFVSRYVLPADGSRAEQDHRLPPSGTLDFSRDDSWPGESGAAWDAGFRGRVRFVRHFGTPTGLAPTDAIELVLRQVTVPCSVRLNGHGLGEIRAGSVLARFAVLPYLQPRNQLTVEADFAEPPAGIRPFREVHLEILAQQE